MIKMYLVLTENNQCKIEYMGDINIPRYKVGHIYCILKIDYFIYYLCIGFFNNSNTKFKIKTNMQSYST